MVDKAHEKEDGGWYVPSVRVRKSVLANGGVAGGDRDKDKKVSARGRSAANTTALARVAWLTPS